VQSAATHALHAVRPAWSWYVPPLQGKQTLSAVTLQPLCWYWPVGHGPAHGVHAVRPLSGWNVALERHWLQAVARPA
jgi:hypothetical protein